MSNAGIMTGTGSCSWRPAVEPPAHRPNAVIVTVLKGSAPRSGLLSIRNVRGPLAGSCHWPPAGRWHSAAASHLARARPRWQPRHLARYRRAGSAPRTEPMMEKQRHRDGLRVAEPQTGQLGTRREIAQGRAGAIKRPLAGLPGARREACKLRALERAQGSSPAGRRLWQFQCQWQAPPARRQA